MRRLQMARFLREAQGPADRGRPNLFPAESQVGRRRQAHRVEGHKWWLDDGPNRGSMDVWNIAGSAGDWGGST
jgi:hypothetical protein